MRQYESTDRCPKCKAFRTDEEGDAIFKIVYNNGHGAPAFDDCLTITCDVCGHHWDELCADAKQSAKDGVERQ